MGNVVTKIEMCSTLYAISLRQEPGLIVACNEYFLTHQKQVFLCITICCIYCCVTITNKIAENNKHLLFHSLQGSEIWSCLAG
jgi:hypothetical protein